MEALSLSQIAAYAGGKLSSAKSDIGVTRISTDSRTIQPNELFVPIRGENFDGHKFVEQVAQKGAAAALVEENWKGNVPSTFPLIRVAD
nr:Mur ligase domain-containing protein [Verrucomicrobiota bacterium]